MKKLLLAIYIIFVVTVSLASRAEFVPPVKLQNTEFSYNSETQTLRMKVKYPNACVRQARAVLTMSEYENVIYIEAAATRFGDGCIRNFQGNLTEVEVTDINARALKFELLRLNQNIEGTYTITTRDGSFRETIDFATLDTTAAVSNAGISGILLTPNSRHGVSENLDANSFVIEINTTP